MTTTFNTGGPAFPMQEAQAIHACASAAVQHLTDPGERDVAYVAERAKAVGGMTLRDHFASQAPDTIPTWFYVPDLQPMPLQVMVPGVYQALRAAPGIEEIADDADLFATAALFVQGDLSPEEIQAVDEKVRAVVVFAIDLIQAASVANDEADKARERIKRENEAYRYFRWRWHYGQLMVDTRGH